MEKAKEVTSKKDIYVAYNVLPLDPGGASTQAIMLLPEVIWPFDYEEFSRWLFRVVFV